MDFQVNLDCDAPEGKNKDPLEEAEDIDPLEKLYQQQLNDRFDTELEKQKQRVAAVQQDYAQGKKREAEEKQKRKEHYKWVHSDEYKEQQKLEKQRMLEQQKKEAQLKLEKEKQRKLKEEQALKQRWANMKIIKDGNKCFFADGEGRKLCNERFDTCDMSTPYLVKHNLFMGAYKTTDGIYGSGYPEAHFFNAITGEKLFKLTDKSNQRFNGFPKSHQKEVMRISFTKLGIRVPYAPTEKGPFSKCRKNEDSYRSEIVHYGIYNDKGKKINEESIKIANCTARIFLRMSKIPPPLKYRN